MALKSEYALGAFYAFQGGALGIALLMWIIALILLCNAARCTTRLMALAVAAMVVFAQMFFTLSFALASGFGFLHPAVSFLLASILWIPVVSFGMTMIGSSWRTAFLITSTVKKGRDDADVKDEAPSIRAALASFARTCYMVTLKHSFIFWVTTVSAFAFVMSVVLALAGACYCTNPTEVTTWASRRTDPRFCQVDEFCHLYSVLGYNATRLRIVGHIVTSSGPPTSAFVRFCPTNGVTPTCLQPETTIQATIVDYAHLIEDQRYLLHGLLTQLNGSTPYRIAAEFTLAGGQTRHKEITVRTVPMPDVSEDVILVGGGDYHSSSEGLRMLMAGMQASPNAHVFFVGGDLSYGNNMRTCYMRWDRFLHAVTSLVNGAGHNLPLLTISGNHEAGGYTVESSRSKYYFYVPYFPQFDEDVPPDNTITYHSHVLGKHLGIICLDSGTIVTVEEQTTYLQQKITEFRGIGPEVNVLPVGAIDKMRFVMVMWHNAVFPGLIRDAPSRDPVPAMERHFLPIIDRNKIPLVFEFHEHLYKRTKPVREGIVRSPGEGTVYLGDGSLGLHKMRGSLQDAAWVDQVRADNYVTILTLFAANTSATVTAVKPSSGSQAVDLMDTFEVRRRF